MAAADTSDASSYLLGDSPEEIRHLVAQAEVYASEARELFDLIGVPPGSSAIDVGCGVMGVLHLLADRVGAEGRVVGIDREAQMVEYGRRLAAERGLQVEFVEGDATATGIAAGSFDFVHARTLLLNVANPAEIVAEMVRLARPSGVVALQEPDAAAWSCDPPHPAFETLRVAILDAYRRTGKDFNIGRRIARMLRDAGLEDVGVRGTARVTAVGDYYQTFLPTIAGLVREVIASGGELGADQVDNHIAELHDHLATPGTVTLQPVMWQAWGRVPAAS